MNHWLQAFTEFRPCATRFARSMPAGGTASASSWWVRFSLLSQFVAVTPPARDGVKAARAADTIQADATHDPDAE
jgi:hypothetical protein